MSLSAAEKVRVVQALDRLGVHYVEAGFPSSNPKEAELFELLADVELEQRARLRVRHDPAPRPVGRGRRRAAVARRLRSRRSSPSSARPGRLHLEKVTKVSPRGEPGDDRRLDRLLPRAAGKRVIYDAEHFFDAWRDDPGYALECLRAAAAAGAENVTLCDTNGSSLPAEVAAATAAVVAELGGAGRGRHPHPQRRRVRRSPTRSPPSTPARAWSRARSTATASDCGNANLVSILPALQLKLGYDVVARGAAAAPDRDRPLRRRAHATPTPDPDQPYVGRNAFAHKGGMHVAGVQADARTFEHLDPELVGNSRDVLISELSGKGSVLSARRGGRDRPRRRRRQARGRAHQGARAPRLSLRGGRRLVRAPAAPRGGRVRVAVPARELPGDHREARRRPASRPRRRSRSGSTGDATCAPRRATAR